MAVTVTNPSTSQPQKAVESDVAKTSATALPVETKEEPPYLEERFAALKRECIKPEDEQAVIDSYERLLEALKIEANRIEALQQDAIPEVAWSDVVANGEFFKIVPPN